MQVITKYLFKTITAYVLLVLLFLLGLQIFIEFIHEFPSLGIGNYGLRQVIIYVLLMLPYDIYQFFPMASLLGFIIALGLLAAHSELIIMRTAGMSLANLTLLLMRIGLVFLVIMILLGEVLSPMAWRKAMRLKSTAISGGQVLLTRQGVWLHHQGGFTNIQSVNGAGELQGIASYQLSEDLKLRATSYAKSGSYQDRSWVFKHVVQTMFVDDKVSSFTWSTQPSALKFNPKLIGITHLDTDQKSLPALYSYIKYRLQSGLDASQYEFAFWQRIFAPLATLVMILFAIPFVFGSLRSSTLGLKMLLGVMIGFAFYMIYQFMGSVSIIYQIPPILAAILPLLLFTIISSILIFRVR